MGCVEQNLAVCIGVWHGGGGEESLRATRCDATELKGT